jgi:hypothetical protein
MDKNQLIEQQMDDFVALFHSIDKTISFNKTHWHGEKGSLHGLIHNEEHRLIMEHGEMAKVVDNFNRKIVLFGTHFGIIAVYPTQPQPSRGSIPTLSYCTTQALSDAIATRFPTSLAVSAKLIDREHFPFLKPTELFGLIDELATYCRDRHVYVGDGLPKPKPIVKKFKQRTHSKKPAEAKPKAEQKPQQPKLGHKSKNQKSHQKQPQQTKPEEVAKVPMMQVQEITPEMLASPDAIALAA